MREVVSLYFHVAKCANVEERLAILHGVGVRVEEVARGRNHFIPEDRVEPADLHGEIVVADFEVGLWRAEAVIRVAVPVLGAVVVEFPAHHLIEDVVAAPHHIQAAADVPTGLGSVDGILELHVERVELALGLIVERYRAIKVAGHVGSVRRDATVRVTRDLPVAAFVPVLEEAERLRLVVAIRLASRIASLASWGGSVCRLGRHLGIGGRGGRRLLIGDEIAFTGRAPEMLNTSGVDATSRPAAQPRIFDRQKRDSFRMVSILKFGKTKGSSTPSRGGRESRPSFGRCWIIGIDRRTLRIPPERCACTCAAVSQTSVHAGSPFQANLAATYSLPKPTSAADSLENGVKYAGYDVVRPGRNMATLVQFRGIDPLEPAISIPSLVPARECDHNPQEPLPRA